MKTLFTLSFILISIASICQNNEELNITTIFGNECAQGELLVKFKTSNLKSANLQIQLHKEFLKKKYSVTEIGDYGNGIELWEFDTTNNQYNLKSAIDSLNACSEIEYAEPNYIIRINGIQNDPKFAQQWALNNTGQTGGTKDTDIDAPEAWEITKGSRDVVVGIFDTGIDYNHEDLKNNIWINPGEIADNNIDDDGNGYIDDIHGYDFVNNDNDPMDENGHGTHVAGIIGAEENGIGVIGVSPLVKLIGLKAFNTSGSGKTSDIIKAFEYAIINNIKITSHSWSGPHSQSLMEMINITEEQDILVVTSAGNDNLNIDDHSGYHFPASYSNENVITVGNIDQHNNKSIDSNWGINKVDIMAPGSMILSTNLNNSYNNLSGTSMAAPFVSGVAALIKSISPEYSCLQIKNQILGGCDEFSSLSEYVSSGRRLNAFNSLNKKNLIPFSVSSQSLSFGVQKTNNFSSALIIKLRNVLDTDLIIDSIKTDSGFWIYYNGEYLKQISPYKLEKNGSDSLFIVFNPDSIKEYHGHCSFYYSIDHTFNINLTGTGVADGTIINGGYIAGSWTKIKSPYYVNGDIEILPLDTLTIEPGVKVFFTGHYKLNVFHTSFLSCKGTENDSILFSAINKDIGWNGIRILSQLYVGEYGIGDIDPSNYPYNNSAMIDTIKYCRFEYAKKELTMESTNIYADQEGAAIYYRMRYGDILKQPLLITHNTFIHNSTKASFGSGSIYLENLGSDNDVIVANNLFTSNNNGGINITDWKGNAFVYKNSIIGNEGEAIQFQHGNVLIANNIIAYNDARQVCQGVGAITLFASDTEANLINNTIVNNSLGLCNNFGSNAKVVNCIIYGNAEQIRTTSNENTLVSYSNIQGGYQGENNIDFDPSFTNCTPLHNSAVLNNLMDLHLLENSVCIDAGDPNPLFNDFDDSRNDIGAYGGNGLIPNTSNFSFHPYGIYNKGYGDNVNTKDLIIFNGKSEPINIVKTEFQKNDFTIKEYCDKINPNSIGKITIGFSPVNTDLLSDSLTIFTEEFSDKERKYKIPVSGMGVNATNLKGNYSGIIKKEDSPFLVSGEVQLNNVIIEPGVTLMFNDNSRILGSGNFQAEGSSKYPIVFKELENGWGGLTLLGQQVSLKYCVIENSSETGVFIYGGGPDNLYPVIIENCIVRNSGTNGIWIGMAKSGYPIISSNLIYNNYREGILIENIFGVNMDSSKLLNNTVVNNGTGIKVNNINSPVIENNILWGNSLNISSKNDNQLVQHNLFEHENVDFIQNNFFGSPNFVDADNGDYRLAANSACIDNGINHTLIKTDLEGKKRIWDGNNDGQDIIDIGCYEFGAPMCTENLEEFINICDGESYNGWSDSGQYQRTLTSMSGCDSIVTTNLTIVELPNPEFTYNSDTLTSTGIFSSYQWFDQDGAISGATSNQYIIEKSGIYYLEVTNENECSAISNGMNLIKTGITDLTQNKLNLVVIPNPNDGKFKIRFENGNTRKYQIQIFNEIGQTILIKEINSTGSNYEEEFVLLGHPKGNYFIKVIDGGKSKTKKIIMR